ncbi:MAG TPA: aromatic amino acid lyase, partial [Solirubrobacteraceae bacterium]
MAAVALSGTGLTPADVVAVARDGAPVALAGDAREAMDRSAAIVARLVDGDEPVYGISTGFGSLANVAIPAQRREELQRALVRSHAAGMGPVVEEEVVRAMLLLRARTLAMGYSGARAAVAEAIVALLNAGIAPVVREHGSLGASGDLAQLLRVADITAAMSVEALLGTDRAFDADLVALRPQPGQQLSAANLRTLLAGSPIVASHRHGDDRVQDAYSLRCAPQVTGAARDLLAHADAVADAELRSAIDNPMVLA